MNERIKELRKSLGLTQAEFGKKIGLKQSSVADLESGRNTPSEQTIVSICREFNVREAWLRTGEGERQEPMTRKQEIEKFFDEVSTLPRDDFRSIVVSFLASTDADGWALLEREMRRLSALLPAGETGVKDQVSLFAPQRPPESPQSVPTGEGDSLPPETAASGLTASQEAELAEIARQMRLETEAAAKSSLSSAG